MWISSNGMRIVAYLDLFVIESQSYVDQCMVARVMEYESVARMRYISQNFKKHVPMHTRLQ